ncbi:MAG TPA: Lrp/AsnC family transcriptional regulator [Candidatus Thermoplasmatota archaeon]|nr:Lrp/AsnC family transcriptional regulator [Candidatus Thermoplasmatota archaeon]
MLDEKDRLILKELREDAKKTTKTIAERTNIPRTTVHDRINKMEQSGIIRKFTVIPDYELVGEPTTAFVFVSYNHTAGTNQRELAEELSKLEGVYEVHLISGDWDILAKVRGRDVETIGELVIERLRDLKGVAKTVTCTVFKTVKEDA